MYVLVYCVELNKFHVTMIMFLEMIAHRNCFMLFSSSQIKGSQISQYISFCMI